VGQSDLVPKLVQNPGVALLGFKVSAAPRVFRRTMALALVMVATACLGALPAQASSFVSQSAASDIRLVLSSPNPAQAMSLLSSQRQAAVRNSVQHMSATLIKTSGGSLPVTKARPMGARGPHGSLRASASGCWYRYWYYAWGNIGIVMAHSWMTLTWCGSGGVITSYVLGAAGGTSSFPTISYSGIVDKGSLNVRWQVRQYVEFRFSAGWGITFDTTPCQQIRGGATGLVAQRGTCDLS
jgi:hypothetical protein